jgi:hypothetical protein
LGLGIALAVLAGCAKTLDHATALKELQSKVSVPVTASFPQTAYGADMRDRYQGLVTAELIVCEADSRNLLPQVVCRALNPEIRGGSEVGSLSFAAGGFAPVGVVSISKTSETEAIVTTRLALRPSPFLEKHKAVLAPVDLKYDLEAEPREPLSNDDLSGGRVVKASFVRRWDGWRFLALAP